MAQIGLFGSDKIGSISESGGTITLQPSILTIGGQQFNETVALNVSATLAAVNTRYQVYAVRSGGNTILAVSANENSIGPAGYTAWKLVGSYYTDGALGFDSFLNINLPYNPDIKFSGTTVSYNHTTSGAWQKIVGTWTEYEDSNNAFATDTFTVAKNGTYNIKACLNFAANATGVRAVAINAGGIRYIGDIVPAASGINIGVSIAINIPLSQGDTIYLEGYQTSGGALLTSSSNGETHLSISRAQDLTSSSIKDL